MRPPPLLVRRVLIGPAWLPLATALMVVCTAAAALAAIAAPLTRRRRVLRLALMAALYLALDVGLLVCCAALSVLHPRAARRRDEAWLRSHQRLLARALSVLIAAARRLLGFTVEVREPPGQQHIAGQPLLVLARHGGPGDSFALAHMLLTRYQRCPVIVLTESLCWDPGLELILSRLPSCFIRQGEGQASARRLAELASRMRAHDAILLFPEGGNWTPGRHTRAIARLRRAGRRQAAADAEGNPNVLPPHPAGVLACLRERPDLGVAVVAHTGLEDLISPAMIWQAVPVTGRPMTVRWWYEPAWVMPETDAERREWLRLQWAIVDSWIDARKAARDGAVTAAAPATAPEHTIVVSAANADPA